MKQELTKYVQLLFAGAQDCEDIRQEILQNTLDRYDDLVAQGKSPQAAYSLAISGIGDISELLGSRCAPQEAIPAVPQSRHSPWKKTLRAVSICLYIISIIPLIVLSELGMEILGLCGTLAIVAVATGLIVIAAEKPTEAVPDAASAKQGPSKAVNSAVNTVGLIAYFALSFWTQAWHITWLIFPIMGAVRGLIQACMDLKEGE